MTGEVTLRGRVLPVGGVREKALGALRNGIKRIVIPKSNMQDILEIPRELKRQMTFIPVSSMREVLDAVLETPPVWNAPESRGLAGSAAPAPAAARSAKTD